MYFLAKYFKFIALFSYAPLYKFFQKNIVRDFPMYNEFAYNITKENDPVRQKHYTTKSH